MTALTGNPATGVTNWLILPNSVVEQTAALANESGFQVIGNTALTGGTITKSNFTNANEIALLGVFGLQAASLKCSSPTSPVAASQRRPAAPLTPARRPSMH